MLYTINQHGVGFPDCRTTLTCLLTPSLRYRQTAPLPPPVPVIASRGSFSVTQTRSHNLTSICQEYKGDRLDISDLSYCGKTAWRSWTSRHIILTNLTEDKGSHKLCFNCCSTLSKSLMLARLAVVPGRGCFPGCLMPSDAA